MAKDLKTVSPSNRLFKYADDTTVLVPSDSDVGLVWRTNLKISSNGLEIIK